MKKIRGSEPVAKQVIADKRVRKTVTTKSFRWFFAVYFSHYIKCKTACFQHEMFDLLEDDTHELLAFVAFRESAKSTIVSVAYVLWCILGAPQKKFIVLASMTQRQARQMLRNIRQELEGNALLRADLGPFQEEKDEWGSHSLVVSNCGARITTTSTEQSIRGLRHGPHRPDLVVCDDVEDLASVQTQESRDKVRNWFTGDILPAGSSGTRVVVVGNMLHDDSLVMRLKRAIRAGKISGTYREWPFLDASGKCLWPGKYPDAASIEAARKRIGSEVAWKREYMLEIVAEAHQVVLKEWIGCYDKLPNEEGGRFQYALLSIDPAISQQHARDRTAIVSAKVFGWGDDMRIYILPNPVNAQMHFIEQQKKAKEISDRLGNGSAAQIIVEKVAYQQALVEQLDHAGYPVEGVPLSGGDKRARLAAITPLLERGQVLFPRKGANVLIQQILGFGTERYDDLADAFSMLVGYCVKRNVSSTGQKEFLFLNTEDGDGGCDEDDEDEELPASTIF